MKKSKFKNSVNTDLDLENYAFGFYANLPVYSKQEIDEMLKEYYEHPTPELKSKLTEAHMRLIVNVAKNIYEKDKSVEFDDLVSAGFEHFGEILDKYNLSEKKNIAIYIYREIEKENQIVENPHHLSKYKTKQLKEIKEKIEKFRLEHGHMPTFRELFHLSGLDYYETNQIMYLLYGKRNIDIIYDIIDIDDTEKIKEWCDEVLNDVQKKVIVARYGLDGSMPKFHREIARELGLSNSRVGQIEQKGLSLLRKLIFRKFGGYENIEKYLLTYYRDNTEPYEFEEKTKTEGYTDYHRDYEGYTEEEFEDQGIGFK